MTVETRVCAINGPIHHVSQEDCSIRSFKRSYIINRCCGFSSFLSFHSRIFGQLEILLTGVRVIIIR